MTEVLNKNQYDENGQKHGYWVVYWSNGNLMSKGNYVNNKRHGYWERYWSNSNLMSKGNYNNGIRKGYSKYYWSDGIERKAVYYL